MNPEYQRKLEDFVWTWQRCRSAAEVQALLKKKFERELTISAIRNIALRLRKQGIALDKMQRQPVRYEAQRLKQIARTGRLPRASQRDRAPSPQELELRHTQRKSRELQL